MRILITNDDGIHARGLAILREAALALSDDVWTIAPDKERSGVGKALSLADPLRVQEVGERRFAVSGTPADCVVIAFDALLKDHPPDLVLSGVNAGFNIADDVVYSGTIGAAMEARFHGAPAIAFSQAYKRDAEGRLDEPWSAAEAHCTRVLTQLARVEMPLRTLLNVNFPPVRAEAVRGLRITRQGYRPGPTVRVEAREDARRKPYYWIGFARRPFEPREDSDDAALAEGYISVTPIRPDMTAHDELPRLHTLLETTDA